MVPGWVAAPQSRSAELHCQFRRFVEGNDCHLGRTAQEERHGCCAKTAPHRAGLVHSAAPRRRFELSGPFPTPQRATYGKRSRRRRDVGLADLFSGARPKRTALARVRADLAKNRRQFLLNLFRVGSPLVARQNEHSPRSALVRRHDRLDLPLENAPRCSQASSLIHAANRGVWHFDARIS